METRPENDLTFEVNRDSYIYINDQSNKTAIGDVCTSLTLC